MLVAISPGATMSAPDSWPVPGPATTIAPVCSPRDTAGQRLAKLAAKYPTIEGFIDSGLNTPGRRFRGVASAANRFFVRANREPQDFELRLVPVSSVQPSQCGEDYVNSSSLNTAANLRNVDAGTADVFDVFDGDLNPIVVAGNGVIVDGNHRHAAHRLNNEANILALVPVGKGNGQIRNLEAAYLAARDGQLDSLKWQAT